MKKGFLVSTALLALLIATPALAERHDHGSGTPPGTAAGGATATTGGTAAGGTGGTHHNVKAGFGATMGGGASSGAGVTVTTGGTGANGYAGRTHRRNGPGFSDGSSFAGGTDGSSDGSAPGSVGTGGPHHERGSSTVINNPFTRGGATGARNTFGGTSHDPGTRFSNGVTVFAPHSHWGHSDHNSAFDALRRMLNATRHFHRGAYNRPNGWYAHEWRYGEFLPYIFFSQQYWIDDWEDFGLDEPPPGTEWVRYGNDALLVDEDTGEVIEVVYGQFY